VDSKNEDDYKEILGEGNNIFGIDNTAAPEAVH
jgi:hypothetical protein